MHRKRKRRADGIALAVVLACCAAVASDFSRAQGAEPGGTAYTLKQAFEAAWSRQPEAAALRLRREAALAQQEAARAWTPEPAALTVSDKTDRFNRDIGARELEVGIAVPLWLPGERMHSGALAEAEAKAVESRVRAARLRIAGVLRESWWQWRRALLDADLASDRLANARLLAADVAKRLTAGDLARADQHQADGAVAAAEAAEAQAMASVADAVQRMRNASVGSVSPMTRGTEPKPEPEPRAEAAAALDLSIHPAFRDLQDRAAVAESAAALGAVRSRANPELTLAATRERDARGERHEPSVTLALRIPFGAGSRHAARTANAQAEATELQVQLALERDRIGAELEAARAQVGSARAQLAAAERRAKLAVESRGFFEKSFRLGETDLPTRLRIEAESVEARRQAASARIEAASAISRWRQALGLLPE